MLYPTLTDVLLDPDAPQHRAALIALRHLLQHYDDTDPADGVPVMDEAIRHAEEQPDPVGWQFITDNAAHRIDGVSVSPGTSPHLDTSRTARHRRLWSVNFPYPGGPNYFRIVTAENLAEAVARVEARWPLADWWPVLMTQGRQP